MTLRKGNRIDLVLHVALGEEEDADADGDDAVASCSFVSEVAEAAPVVVGCL